MLAEYSNWSNPHGPMPERLPPADRPTPPGLAATNLRGAGGTTPLMTVSQLLDETPVARPAATGGLKLGQRLGRCLITERVGGGATGTVYRALHQTLDISVAVKVLHTAHDPRVAALLRREAKALAMLSHPNIVRVFDFDDSDSRPYLVLEWVDGLSLAELIRQCGHLPADRVLRVARHVGAALAEVTRLGGVHRDVKPANVLMTRDGTAKLADLGLASLRQHLPGESMVSNMAGTVLYMAPELFRGAKADFRSDLYSLGCTLFEALVGRPPFAGRTAHEVMFRHVEDVPPPLRDLAPDCPPAVDELIRRCLMKAPQARFGSWMEFLECAGRAAHTAVPAPTTSIQVMQTMRAPG